MFQIQNNAGSSTIVPTIAERQRAYRENRHRGPEKRGEFTLEDLMFADIAQVGEQGWLSHLAAVYCAAVILPAISFADAAPGRSER